MPHSFGMAIRISPYLFVAALAVVGATPAIVDAREELNGPRASANAAIVESDQVEPAAVGSPREFARSADGLFYVDAVVNGQSVRFLVDTGASIVVLTPGDAARVGVTPAVGGFTAAVETASGRSAMAWTTLDHVQVAGRRVEGLRAAVVRGGLGVSLLGQNFLSRLGGVTIRGDRMRID